MRLKSLFLCRSCVNAFTVVFLILIINGYYENVHFLEQAQFSLLSSQDEVLDMIREVLIIPMTENTISLF